MLLTISIVFYAVVMLAVGLYAARKVKTSTDYVLAGRSLPFYMALATVFATWFGSESILGTSANFAQGGFSNIIEDPFGFALCLIIIGVFFNRKLYGLNFLTIGDYFKHRYNTLIAVFLSLVIIVSYFGWVAAQLLALGLVISAVFTSVTLPVAIIISAALVVLYTYFGGMYSVAMLDTIQSLVIVVGLSVISFFLVSEVGGFSSLIQGTPESYFTFTPGSSGNLTEWLVFLTALMTAAFGGVPQQDVYQRAMSAKSVKVSMWASITGGFVYLIIVMLPISIVASARILYPEIAATDVENLLMRTIQEHTPIVLQVLFFGALISAIVSTASGALLAPGTLLAENVVKPFYKNIGDALRLRIIRIALLVIAIIGTSLALKDDARIYDLVSSAYSVTLVAAFIPLTFGLYTKWVNAFGAFFSVSAGIMFWQAAERIGTEVPSTFIGFCASFVAIIIGSYVGNLIEKNKDISL